MCLGWNGLSIEKSPCRRSFQYVLPGRFNQVMWSEDVGSNVENERRFHVCCRRVGDVRARRCTATWLFSDAEAGKNPAQEIVAGELAGDFVQGLLGAAKLFGDELAGAAVRELTLGLVDVTARAG